MTADHAGRGLPRRPGRTDRGAADPQAGPGEVLLRVTYSGLCGTDATEYRHGPRMVPLNPAHPVSGHLGPMVLGHEFIGEVVEDGLGAEEFAGRRVASGAGISCGTCAWCRRAAPICAPATRRSA